jgi:D-arabinan exo alpha-(1,3)/(1,5)-arabinofuranosidase (non-reducing end)
MKTHPLTMIFLSLATLCLVAFASGCGCGDDDDSGDDDVNDEAVNDDANDDVDDDADDDADDDIDDDADDDCPEDEIAAAKAFLVAENGDAARAAFLNILNDYPNCTQAHFGIVLADQLRFVALVDGLLYYISDPLPEERNPTDVGDIIADYAGNLLAPIVGEILDHLEPCREDESLKFEIERFSLRLLGMEWLIYAGEYDVGDALIQSAEFALLSAGLDTVLSFDLHFDMDIIIDGMNEWPDMDVYSMIIDVLDTILSLFDDENYPDFLRLTEDAQWLLPRAGLSMGQAFQYYHDGIGKILVEEIDATRDVTGCSDRNGDGLCAPSEFIHGVFYSLPTELHELLMPVEISMRNAYWDDTELDVDPDNPNPFRVSKLNPILRYFGLPGILLPIGLDLGEFYSDPNPDTVRSTAKIIIELLKTIVELLAPPIAQVGADAPLDPLPYHRANVPQEGPAPGIETVSDIAALPYLQTTARSKQLSSHDPSGGNDDGFTPPNHLYVDERGEFVVFDQFGPGCIYRMQFTHTWSIIGNMRIYVDDMEIPVLEGPIWLLFFGGIEPFTKPLVQSMFSASGTNFSYMPIAFAERCKITYNIPPEFYGISYVKYDADTQVTSFTGTENMSVLRAQFENVGDDPKPDVASETITGAQNIGVDQAADILDLEQGGAVWRLFLEIDPFTTDAAQDLWIVAQWDGIESIAVEAPVNQFFGSYMIADTPRTLLYGFDDGRFYCYFPMPFQSEALIRLENRGDAPVDVSWEIVVAQETYAPQAGYFKTVYSEENPVPVGLDYPIAERHGAAGKWIGWTYTMRGPLGRWYLEGDERFYYDGLQSPAMYGTGTEDYFNGGWYFLMGTFDEPMTGNPSNHVFADHDMTGAYRLHVGDAVHYLDSVRLGIEHGSNNAGATEHHSSVSYIYERSAPMLVFSDEVNIGDAASEAAHGYSATEAQVTGTIDSFFGGEDDQTPFSDRGMAVSGQSVFIIAVDPSNEGVVLRRRFDLFSPAQRARVLVDGTEVGVWYHADSSQTKRFAEDDFVLPPSATTGKSSLEITLLVESEAPWTELHYEAYSIVP